jgi:hypothetical protein
MRELIVDSFAGGAGASTGIEWALGSSPDIAINHSREAIDMHALNHPHTKHYCEDVWKVAARTSRTSTTLPSTCSRDGATLVPSFAMRQPLSSGNLALMNATGQATGGSMTHAWRMLDIVLALSTMAFAAMLLDAATSLTSNGMALIGILTLSAVPFLCAITARLIRALLAKQKSPWLSLTADRWILVLHPLTIAAVLLATNFDWALEARFALSRPSLDSVAHEANNYSSDARETNRWIGLYRIEAIRVDPSGRVRLELGDCQMFASCDLEFDQISDCVSRGWIDYRKLNEH